MQFEGYCFEFPCITLSPHLSSIKSPSSSLPTTFLQQQQAKGNSMIGPHSPKESEWKAYCKATGRSSQFVMYTIPTPLSFRGVLKTLSTCFTGKTHVICYGQYPDGWLSKYTNSELIDELLFVCNQFLWVFVNESADMQSMQSIKEKDMGLSHSALIPGRAEWEKHSFESLLLTFLWNQIPSFQKRKPQIQLSIRSSNLVCFAFLSWVTDRLFWWTQERRWVHSMTGW